MPISLAITPKMIEYRLLDTDVLRQNSMCLHVLRRLLTIVSTVEQRPDQLLAGTIRCPERTADTVARELGMLGFRHARLEEDDATQGALK